MSSAFNLDFEVSGIHGYVMMDGVMPALTEITCTFWMRSTDTTNYGTPVSYAVEHSDNAFLLIDYNGSVPTRPTPPQTLPITPTPGCSSPPSSLPPIPAAGSST